MLFRSLRGVVDDEVRLEVGEVDFRGTDEHVLDEVGLPCYFHDEAYSHAGVLVGAAVAVDDIELLAGELVDGDFLDSFPSLFGDGFVVVGIFFGCPPYFVFGVCVKHDELVFRRAAGVDACHHVDSAKVGDDTLFKALKRERNIEDVNELVGALQA